MLDQLEQALAHLGVGNAVVVVHEFEGLTRVHRIAFQSGHGDVRQPLHRILVVAAAEEFGRHFFEEERHIDAERLGDLGEIAGADAIGSALVFLDLLEGDSDRLAEFGLADADSHAPATDPPADVLVDRMGAIF